MPHRIGVTLDDDAFEAHRRFPYGLKGPLISILVRRLDVARQRYGSQIFAALMDEDFDIVPRGVGAIDDSI